MERERNSDNTEETTLELNDELSPESSETAKIDIEGGEIVGKLDDYTDKSVERYKARTTRWIAYLLIGIFGVSFVIHYAVIIHLATSNQNAAVEIAERTFGAWLPIVSGFVGAAVTYFFTRERNERR